jgi:hypothetical protein
MYAVDRRAHISLMPARRTLRRMPFKSKAQRRKFAELLVEGKITDEQYEEWNRSTGKKALPERVHPKKQSKKKSVAKSRRRVSVKAKQSKARRRAR